jgi:hypothetical protein
MVVKEYPNMIDENNMVNIEKITSYSFYGVISP